jgi:hypothetical protein
VKKAIRRERANTVEAGLLRPAATVVKEQADMDHATDGMSPGQLSRAVLGGRVGYRGFPGAMSG